MLIRSRVIRKIVSLGYLIGECTVSHRDKPVSFEERKKVIDIDVT